MANILGFAQNLRMDEKIGGMLDDYQRQQNINRELLNREREMANREAASALANEGQSLQNQQARMSLAALKRGQEIEAGAQAAIRNRQPRVSMVPNPNMRSLAELRDIATAGPPETQSALMSELEGGAPGQTGLVYPGEGFNADTFQQQPEMVEQRQTPSASQVRYEYFMENGLVEQAEKVKKQALDAAKDLAEITKNPQAGADYYFNVTGEKLPIAQQYTPGQVVPVVGRSGENLGDLIAGEGGKLAYRDVKEPKAPNTKVVTFTNPEGTMSRQALIDETTGAELKELQPWAKVKSQVTNVNVAGANPVAQSTFVDPATGNPLVFDKATGTYKVATVEGGSVAPKPTAYTPESAAKAQMIEQAKGYVPDIRSAIVKPDGTINREIIAGMATRFPFTEGRRVSSLMLDAIEAKLRAESGAAVPEPEVKRIAKRYIPQVGDSDDNIRLKLDNMEKFLSGTSDKMNTGRAPTQSKASAPVKVGGFTVRRKD